jgi:mannosylglycerate hydrolase
VPVAVARRLHGRELFGRYVNGYRIGDGIAVLEVGDDPEPEWLDMELLVEELTLATAEGRWTLRVVAAPRRRLAANVPVPPLGWTSVRPVHVPGTVPGTPPFGAVELHELTRIVRGKDAGDSYNYAPPSDDVLVDEPTDERLETLEDGPLRRVYVLHRTYVWDDRRVETQTRVEQRAGEPYVRVRIDLDNQCDDQRIRVHVPLRSRATGSLAEGQFAVVERGREVEGGYGEVAVPTFPASSFVAAGGIALLLEHASEYEVVGDELALTVLRSTGLISRNDNPWREEPAGPSLPIPAAQMHGPHSFSFAYCPREESVLEQAERFRHPFLTAPGTGDTNGLRSHAGPSLEGSADVVLTALQPDRARIVNESPEPQTVSFAGERLELRPWEIRNVSL